MYNTKNTIKNIMKFFSTLTKDSTKVGSIRKYLKKNSAQSSIQTAAALAKFMFKTFPTPPGKVYGELFLNKWPT